jgi:hypothetical protein
MSLRCHPTAVIVPPTDAVAGGILPPLHSDRDAVSFPRHQRKSNGVIVPCGQKVRSHVGSWPVTDAGAHAHQQDQTGSWVLILCGLPDQRSHG